MHFDMTEKIVTDCVWHKANKKNTCVSGSPTDPKNSGPTLNFFFFKKIFDFSYHKFARKLTKNG